MSTTRLTSEQVKRLKVTEIKEELKKRGVDQSGSKAHLIRRLTDIIEKESPGPPETPSLTDKEKTETITTDNKEAAAEMNSPAEEQTETKGKATVTEEDGEIKPKHTPIVYNIPRTDAAAMKADEEAKKKRRAERFGIVDVAEREAKKQKSRTERFGLKFSDGETTKLEQRVKRFAQPSTSGSESAKDSKGVIDLSHIVAASSMTEEEKKRRRAERFGTKKN